MNPLRVSLTAPNSQGDLIFCFTTLKEDMLYSFSDAVKESRKHFYKGFRYMRKKPTK